MALDPMQPDTTVPAAVPQSVPVQAVPSLSPIDQLRQHEQAEKDKLARAMGTIQTQREQEGYQQTIDSQKPASPPADETFMEANRRRTGAVVNQILDMDKHAYSGAVHAVTEVSVAADQLFSSIPGVREALTAISGTNHADFAKGLRAVDSAITSKPTTVAGGLSQSVTQFTLSFAAVAAAAPEMGATSLLARGSIAATEGGVAQAAGFNPEDPRLSNLLREHLGLRDVVTGYLASKPGDTEWDGRLKNFLEGAGLTAAGDAVINGFTSVLKGMRAAGSLADTTKAAVDAKPTPIEHPSPQPAPKVDHPVEHTVDEATGEHTVTSANGKAVAYQNGPHLQVKRIDVAEAAQGNGEGKALMDKLHDVATERKIPLVSDISVSPDQQRVYASMKKNGADVTQHPGAVVNETTGNLISDHPNKPVFSVAPKVPQVEQPWTPSALTKTDTANPAAAGVKPGEPTFNPQAAAQRFISIPPARLTAVREAIADGRYSDIPSMIDDTHRTIPWDTLSDGANLKGLFNAVEGEIGGLIKDTVGIGRVTNETTAKLAADIGGSVQEVERLFDHVTDRGGLSARITAAYNIMVASGRHLGDLVEGAEALNPKSPEGIKAILAVERQVQLHAAIVGQVRGSSSELARALQAHRSLKASTEVALNNMSDLMGTTMGPKGVTKLLKALNKANNLAGVNAAAAAVSKRTFGGVVKEIVQNGLVYNPKTQLVNIAGNIVGAITGTLDRVIAGGVGTLRGVLMPSAERASMRSALAYTAGQVEGLKSSWPLFVNALKSEPTISAAGRPLFRQIARSTTGKVGADLTVSQVINTTGTVIRYSGRTMGAIDNLNMGMGYTADLYSRSYITAAMEADAKGLQGPARQTFLDQRISDLRQKPSADVREKSMDAGLYQSYQEAPRTFAGKPIGNLLNANPVMKIVIAPFYHRPANFLRQSIMDRTPLGLASSNLRARLFSGNADGDVAIARQLMGISGLIAGWEMHKQGVLTDGGLGGHNTESLINRQPYSVTVGGKWRSIARLEPLGTWLSVSADVSAAVDRHYDPNDDTAISNLTLLARSAMQVIAHVSMDKSFFASVDKFTKAVSEKNPTRADELWQSLMEDNARKLIPFSGLLNAVTNATDKTPRTTGGDGLMALWNSVLAHLPVTSQDQPPRRDLLGRPVVNADDYWWNPFSGGPESSDPAMQSLASVAAQIRTPPRSLLGFTLDAKQYDELITRSTEAKIFPGGKSLEGYLRDATETPYWKSMANTADGGVTARTQLVQTAVDAAYRNGTYQFTKAHPDFVAAKQAQIQQKIGKFIAAK